jgi:hypothetical protein
MYELFNVIMNYLGFYHVQMIRLFEYGIGRLDNNLV